MKNLRNWYPLNAWYILVPESQSLFLSFFLLVSTGRFQIIIFMKKVGLSPTIHLKMVVFRVPGSHIWSRRYSPFDMHVHYFWVFIGWISRAFKKGWRWKTSLGHYTWYPKQPTAVGWHERFVCIKFSYLRRALFFLAFFGYEISSPVMWKLIHKPWNEDPY